MAAVINEKIFNILREYIPENRIACNVNIAPHTSFRIGGPADVLLQAASKEELAEAIEICKENDAPYIILGHCTNVLVPDEGLRKVVILLYPYFANYYLTGTRITAEAGALLSAVANFAYEEGLCGMEFAAGIPGTIGGALCMNAGAYGSEISDICRSAEILMPSGEIAVLSNKDMEFAYRSSALQKEGIALSTVFDLKYGDKNEIKNIMQDLSLRRRTSQPLEYPSAGSIFKRPEGHFAGKLISDSGLKGISIGGAQVSEKHGGFIINKGGATAADVLELIKHIKETVYSNYNVELVPEVKILCNL